MTTALLCDDEPLMRASLRDHLQTLWPELRILGEAESGPQALSEVQSLQPDIAFLDIQMPGLTGIQVAQLIEEPTQVVFVTAFDQYALEAFEAHAVDYILKPVDPVRLARVVTRLKRRDVSATQSQLQAVLGRLANSAQLGSACALDWLQVDAGKQVRMVHVDDVMYFESDHKYTRVVADDCDGLIRMSLKELVASLDPQHFLQIHRSAVVNRRFVRSVHRRDDQMELEIRGRPERLRVSESNQPLFRPM